MDPRSSEAVAAALVSWATARFNAPVELSNEARAVGAGFDSYIHLVQLSGEGLPPEWLRPLVVRILPSADRADQATAEAAAQDWAADNGFPAPRVLVALMPGELLGLPVQIMERALGVTMLDALKKAPWRARSLVDQLGSLHLRLHSMDPAGWPGAVDAGDLAAKRLSLPRRAAAMLEDPVLSAALERAEAMVEEGVGGTEAVVCHGDFHPLNVMVDGSRAALIDWTDAGLGPREADVSRSAMIFHLASIAANSGPERAVLRVAGPRLSRRYLRTYQRGAKLDADRMRRWEALHSLHGWAQVEMLHAGAFETESSSAGSEARAPRELAVWLRRRFEAALS